VEEDQGVEEEGGVSALVTPPSLDYEQFKALATSKEWTLAADEQLCAVMNTQCDVAGVEPAALTLQPPDVSAPESLRDPAKFEALRARTAVLQSLNERLVGLLPLIDLRVTKPHLIATDDSNFAFESALAARVARLRGLVLTRVKTAYWKTVLRATEEYTNPPQDEYDRPDGFPELRVNRLQTESKLMDTYNSRAEKLRRSLFGQLKAQTVDEGWRDSQFRRAYSHVEDDGQQRSFFVKFKDEGVSDNGGPYRAALNQAIIKEPREHLDLMVGTPNAESGEGADRDKLLFNAGLTHASGEAEAGVEDEWRFWGQLVGMATRQGMLMDLSLPSLLWKPLVMKPVTLRDLRSVHKRAADALEMLMHFKRPEDDADAEFKEMASAELQRVARSVQDMLHLHDTQYAVSPALVTWDNAASYARFMMRGYARQQERALKAFESGLSAGVPTELLVLFTPAEAEAVFCGAAHVDVELLRRFTEYEFCNPGDAHVQYFWEVLRSWPQQELRRFITFVAERSRLPASPDEWSQKLTIEAPSGGARDRPDQYLPKGMTCFFKLILPKYTSAEILGRKLKFAMDEAVTMDADVNMTEASGYAVFDSSSS
jgi:hypothetical protein